MAYNTTGQSHKQGVRIEELVVNVAEEMFNDGQDIFNFQAEAFDKFNKELEVHFEHKGGTQVKADAIIYGIDNTGIKLCKKISIKKKQFENNKIKGTVDLINKSFKAFAEAIKNNSGGIEDISYIEKNITNWLESKRSIITCKNDIESIRDEFNIELSKELHNMTQHVSEISDLIKNEFLSTDYLIIARTEKVDGDLLFNEIYVGENGEIINKIFPSQNYFFKPDIGKSSARICFLDDNRHERQSPFRVRLVLNNGLSAYYGFSNANDSSCLTIKIQIDGVIDLLNNMKNYNNFIPKKI